MISPQRQRLHAAAMTLPGHMLHFFSNISYKYKPHTSWSSCSRKVIEGSLNSVTYQCLRNVPERMFPISSCGDGVVDAGEQCDCGPAEFCDNPCCVAKTCKFAVNASCASGPCCDIKVRCSCYIVSSHCE